jgi:hypothetical protein
MSFEYNYLRVVIDIPLIKEELTIHYDWNEAIFIVENRKRPGFPIIEPRTYRVNNLEDVISFIKILMHDMNLMFKCTLVYVDVTKDERSIIHSFLSTDRLSNEDLTARLTTWVGLCQSVY